MQSPDTPVCYGGPRELIRVRLAYLESLESFDGFSLKAARCLEPGELWGDNQATRIETSRPHHHVVGGLLVCAALRDPRVTATISRILAASQLAGLLGRPHCPVGLGAGMSLPEKIDFAAEEARILEIWKRIDAFKTSLRLVGGVGRRAQLFLRHILSLF